jgi:RNA polymerase sigma-70 factor (ECF subfamily)
LEGLLVAQASPAYALALSITGCPADAEDACQEAFLRATRDIGRYRPISSFRSWLLVLVRNSAISLVRSRQVRRQGERDMTVPQAQTEPAAAGGRDLAAALQGALALLEERFRLPVLLHYQQGLSHAEVAEVLEQPPGTVAANISRGVAQLRTALKRAGFDAAHAAVLGALAQTAPPVPATLIAAVENLAAGGVIGQGSAVAAAGTAAKGGLIVKIVAGVLLAGALAGGLSAFGFRHSEPPPAAQAAPPAAAEEKGERIYQCEQLLRVHFAPGYSEFVWAGPRTSAHNYKFEGLAADNDGNVYGAVKGQVGRGGAEGGVAYECVIMKYDPKTERLTRLAGGARGAALDGPGEMAQLNYQFYSGGGLQIDSKRGYLYLSDVVNGTIRRISTKDGRVTTVAPDLKPAASAAVDQEGVVYVHVPYTAKRGLYRLTPEGQPGAETYRVERAGEAGNADGSFIVADAKRGKVYNGGRGGDISTVQVWDLKAGGGAPVKPVPIATPSVKDTNAVTQCWKSDGPLEGAVFYCPVNLNISPDGRYLYIGGGDEPTYRRIDVDGRRVSSLYRLADGRFTWKERKEGQDIFNDGSPSAFCEVENGTCYAGASAHGLFRLKPVGRQ